MTHFGTKIKSGLTALACTLSFEAAADPAPQAAGVAAINQALIKRCAESYSVNISLANAALTKNDDIAHRDIIRIINECAHDLKKPRREVFSSVGAEALGGQRCENSICGDPEKEKLAETVLEANKRYTSEYAIELLAAIRSTCDERLVTSCVNDGIDKANENMTVLGYDWLFTSQDNRILSIGDQPAKGKVEAVVAPLELETSIQAILALKSELDAKWAKGDREDFTLKGETKLAGDSFSVDAESGAVKFDGLGKASDVSSWNDFWRISLDLSKAECKGILRDMGELDASEITSGLTVVRGPQDSDKVCSSDNVDLTIAF